MPKSRSKKKYKKKKNPNRAPQSQKQTSAARTQSARSGGSGTKPAAADPNRQKQMWIAVAVAVGVFLLLLLIAQFNNRGDKDAAPASDAETVEQADNAESGTETDAESGTETDTDTDADSAAGTDADKSADTDADSATEADATAATDDGKTYTATTSGGGTTDAAATTSGGGTTDTAATTSGGGTTDTTTTTTDNAAAVQYADIMVQDYGKITVELDASAAPLTVKNFTDLAESGFYNGLTFHRIMDGFMAQGGDPLGNGTGGADATIYGEFSSNGYKDNTLSHTRGTISMARASNDKNSASSQFFIVQSDSTFLDGDYAAFGHVTDGMEVVDEICKDAKPTDDNGTIAPEEQPIIESITIRDK